jgi:formate dehydrogenase subunit gamma
MSTAAPRAPMDSAVIVARTREDVVVGPEIVRHSRFSRIVHWTVAGTFILGLLTGMPIWTPVFGWMAYLFGGLTVARLLHPWVGIAFFLAILVQFFEWWRQMIVEPWERDWVGPRVVRYMRYDASADDPRTGKYNGGQKLYFWAVSLGAVGLLLSGLLMWFPTSFPKWLMQSAFIIHDLTFIAFAASLVFHIYLSTAAEPGTFGSMIRGTVTRTWARVHHPRWYREVTGEEPRRS